MRRVHENPDRKAAGLYRDLTKWWTALWTVARLEELEPTNNVAERALPPSVCGGGAAPGRTAKGGTVWGPECLAGRVV